MDQGNWQAVQQPDLLIARGRSKHALTAGPGAAISAGGPRSDDRNQPDTSSTPASKHQATAKEPPATPCTPKECATMLNAVEEAMKCAQDVTPESAPQNRKLTNLQAWLEASGVQLPTPAAKDLHSLATAAEDSKRLKKQLEALREAELELAAREAEENAENFAMLEQENLSLAADNARLQQQIADLEALNKAAAAEEKQRAQHASLEQWTDGMEARANMALQRAEHTRRLSGVYERKQLASLKQLDDAEEQLSAVKALTPTSRAQQKEMHRRLLQAEQDVQSAAAAAQEATQKLQKVLDEKEQVQLELREIKQQLESQPLAQQHAELYQKLAEVHQTMMEEKQQHQKLTGSLLEHAGRLSHKYYALSDDYGELNRRYRHLSSTNEQLASQLKEAHEALYELQATVQATPPAKRREHQHLMSRVVEAEQAVNFLEKEKHQLHERLLQAQAFIACLEKRVPGQTAAAQQQLVLPKGVAMETPVGKSHVNSAFIAATPVVGVVPPSTAAAAPQANVLSTVAATEDSSKPQKAAAVAAAAPAPDVETFGGFITPVKGRSNPLFDLPETPGSVLQAESAPEVLGGFAHLASFPVEPVSPILAAAAQALSAAAGQQQKQQIQLSAASHELQTVQQEQLGLRDEISKAKSALADIAGQLRASICGSAVSGRSVSASTHSSGSSSSKSGSRSGAGSVAGGKASSKAATSSRATESGLLGPAAASGRKGAFGVSNSSATSKKSMQKVAGKQISTANKPATKQLPPLSSTAKALNAQAASTAQDFTFPQLSSSSSGSTSSSHGPQHELHWSTSASKHAAAPSPASAVAESGKGPSTSKSSAGVAAASASACSGGGSAATGSAKGSLSLDDLIREAESVSLEYGMSPQPNAALQDTATTLAATPAAPAAVPAPVQASTGVRTGHQQQRTAAEAAARNVALALIEHALTQESGCNSGGSAAGATPDAQQTRGSMLMADGQQERHKLAPVTPVSVSGSTRNVEQPGSSLAQQQQQQSADQQLMQQRLAEYLADTPGSASSSAGAPAGAAAAARQWLQQQAAPPRMGSLEGTPTVSAPVGTRASDMQSAYKPPAAAAQATPPSTGPVAVHQTPLDQTPMGAEGHASNLILQPSPEASVSPGQSVADQQRSLLTPSFATPTALANQRAALAGLLAYDEAAADDATSGARKEDGCNDSAANMPLQWQQPADAAGAAASGNPYVTPAAGIAAHKGLAPARQHAADIDTSPAAALLAAARASPATPAAEASEALQSAAAALLASISPAGLISPGEVVPARVLQQMTPEWLKDLRQRCQQGTLQVQELRQQLGLATPEQPAGNQCSAGVQSGLVAASPAAAASATTSPVDGTNSGGPEPQPTTADAVKPPASSTRPQTVATTQNVSPNAVPAAAATGQVPTSALSQASSRSNINKLRRRAIAQAAAAAAVMTEPSGTSPAPNADGAATAAAEHEDFERSDSAGSLAQYMQQGQRQGRAQTDSAATSRSTSRQQLDDASPMPYRPGCPTPGSAYSDVPTPCASSPDLLIAGLNSSRMAAKQLQEQLLKHLDKTASLPNLPRSDSLATAAAAAEQSWLSPAPSILDTAGDLAAAESTPVQSARTSSRLAGAALTAGDDSPGLLPDASPITPGAALNANAESRMLSPSVQLDQVFEASVPGPQQERHLDDGPTSVSSYNSRQQHVATVRHPALGSFPVSPQDSTCYSSSVMTLPAAAAVPAAQEPRKDTAIAAHPVPAVSNDSPAIGHTHGSVRAHQLSTSPASTHLASSVLHSSMEGHSPCLSDAAHGCSAAAPSPATASSASHAASVPSLGSWAGPQATAAAVEEPGQEVASFPVEVTPGASASLTAPSRLQAAVIKLTTADTTPSSHPVPSAAGSYVDLGDSPTSTRMTAVAAAAAAGAHPISHAVPADSSQAFSAGTPSSCCTSQQVLSVVLRSSPDTVTSCGTAASGLAMSAAPGTWLQSSRSTAQQTAAVSPVASLVLPVASNCSPLETDSDPLLLGTTAATVVLNPSVSTACIGDTSQRQQHNRVQPTVSQNTAPQPAVSSCTEASSCRYATPAMDFGTPGGTAEQEVYFTGLQNSIKSVAGRPNTAHRAASVVVAFGGFSTGATPGLQAEQLTSPAALPAAPAVIADNADTSNTRLLQQLLASPTSTCASVIGSPGWAAAVAAAGQSASRLPEQGQGGKVSDAPAEEIHDMGDHGDALVALNIHSNPVAESEQSTSKGRGGTPGGVGANTCSRGSQTPPALEPATIDTAAVSGTAAGSVQRQQQGSQGSSDDLTGMTFEQRLELLCSEDSSGSRSTAAAADGEQFADSVHDQADERPELLTPVLPAHVTCRATQTSPLLVDAATQRWPARDVETQVTPKPAGGGR